MSLKNIRIGDHFVNISDSPMPLWEKIARTVLLVMTICLVIFLVKIINLVWVIVAGSILVCFTQLIFSSILWVWNKLFE